MSKGTTIASKVTDWITRLSTARETASHAVEQLSGADQELRNADEQIDAEIATLASAPPPKAEAIRAAEKQIDAAAERLARDIGQRLLHAAAGRVGLSPTGEVQGVVAGDLLMYGLLPSPLGAADFLALAPNEAQASLRKIIEALDYTPGPALAERPAMIRDLQAKRRDIETQHRQLVDEARAAGVVLEDLPANRAARHREATEAQRIRAYNVANADAIRRGVIPAAETVEQAR